jgi:regulator of RNase E activity RraA
VHKALGCLGVITDGAIRDIPQWAPGFQALAGSIAPSHAWVHLQSFDEPVTVAGMAVRPGDLIHADAHGAIVVPFEAAGDLPAACDLLVRREAVILDVATSEDFTLDKLRAAMAQSAEIH